MSSDAFSVLGENHFFCSAIYFLGSFPSTPNVIKRNDLYVFLNWGEISGEVTKQAEFFLYGN